MTARHSRAHAFTLVELAIVIVIIGLIIGGVLAGQELIKASQRRGIAREYSNYKAAVMTFLGKYNSIPGDMKNATSFWGQNCPSGGADHHPAPMGPTCNGDGDSIFMHNIVGTNEYFNFWHHLQNAGYITPTTYGAPPAQESTIARIVEVSGTTYYPNVPTAAIPGTAWTVAQTGYPWWPGTTAPNTHTVASTNYIEGSYGHAFRLGCPGYGGCDAGSTNTPITPLDAFDIDTKLDDGLAGKGNIVVLEELQRGWGTDTDCAENPDGSSAPRSNSDTLGHIVYNTNAAGDVFGCTLIFKRMF